MSLMFAASKMKDNANQVNVKNFTVISKYVFILFHLFISHVFIYLFDHLFVNISEEQDRKEKKRNYTAKEEEFQSY